MTRLQISAVVPGLTAFFWAVLLLDPLGPATIDPDATSSVLYYQRILAGTPLETFVPTTPKPLLTVVYGVTWSLFHDWRVLVWETIVAWGVAVGATAAFVTLLTDRVVGTLALARSAGGIVAREVSYSTAYRTLPSIAAAAIATAALLASSDLMLEVSRANSLIWALAGWSVAGAAMLVDPPRPRVAGGALLLATLCRFETFALTAVAVLAVIVVARRARRQPPRSASSSRSVRPLRPGSTDVERRPRREQLVGAILAATAMPIVLLHDWLLSTDPLYWLSVPTRYTEVYNAGLASIAPLAYAGTIVGRLAPEWAFLLLATVGTATLIRARLWLTLAGVGAIGLGAVALLFWLAVRGTYISNRYYEPIDLALIVTASVGVGWLTWRLSLAIPASVPLATLAAITLGVATMWPPLPWDRRATRELASARLASMNAAALSNWIASTQLDLVARPMPTTAVRPPTRPPTSFGLLVPSRDVSRLAVETALGLDVIGDLYAAMLAGGVDNLRPGQVVIHDAAADRPASLFKVFEVAAPTGRVEPVLGPDIDGVWIARTTP